MILMIVLIEYFKIIPKMLKFRKLDKRKSFLSVGAHTETGTKYI